MERTVWEKYDEAADKCSGIGVFSICDETIEKIRVFVSSEVIDLIEEDPESFEERVRLFAYADAMKNVDR